MKMKLKNLFFILNVCPIFIPLVEANNENCGEELKLLKSEVGSAGTWENIKNSSGSLKKESSLLINKGVDVSSGKFFSLVTTPKVFLKNSSDEKYCEEKSKQTKTKPITFGPRFFKSLEDLQSWVGDVSKGSGKDGEELYEQCDKSCSPVYTYHIKENTNSSTGKFEASLSAACGLPRDKDDNKYILELWCGKK